MDTLLDKRLAAAFDVLFMDNSTADAQDESLYTAVKAGDSVW